MDAVVWLKFLHRYTEHDVELRRFHNSDRSIPPRQIWTRVPDDVETFVERYDQADFGTFFGVATRTNRGGKVDHCQEVPALWIDCDNHRPLDELRGCHMPPSAIIESGGGIHAYWILDEPYDVRGVTVANKDGHPVMAALACLKRVFNGDAAVVDIARVMRLPGTTNSKRETPVVCAVLEHNDSEYGFDDIVDWLGWQRELVGEPVDPFLAAMDELGIKPPIDVESMLDGMVYGENVHDVQIRVAASMQGAGIPDDQAVERIISATRLAVGQEGARWDWTRETKNVQDMVRTARQKFGAPPPKVVDIGPERDKRSMKWGDDFPSKKSSGDDEPVCTAVARSVLKGWPGKLISTAGELWRYEHGVWKKFDKDDDAEMMSAFQRCFDHLKASSSPGNKQSAYRWIVHNHELLRRGIEWDTKPIIVANNGVYEIEEGRIRPHSPDDYATIKVECDLDLKAGCPTWMEFLNLALPPESVAILREWFGAALVRGKKREITRALLLKGGDNTGKSQISAVMMALRGGKKNVKSSKVKTLAGEFGYQQFLGSSGWIADDAVGQNEFVQPEAFKILVTGEPVSVNRKGTDFIQASFDFPVLLTCNHLPRVRDDSNAVYSRSIVIPMTRRFNEETAPPEETKKTVIREELAGVINWAVEGWRRLQARGRYEMPEQLMLALKDFRDGNTPVVGWVRECVKKESYGAVDNRDIRASFTGYFAANFGDSERTPQPRDIYKALADLGFATDTTKVKGAFRQRGMHLKEEGLAYWLEGIKKTRSDTKGSGCKQDEVNKFFQQETKTSQGHRPKSTQHVENKQKRDRRTPVFER